MEHQITTSRGPARPVPARARVAAHLPLEVGEHAVAALGPHPLHRTAELRLVIHRPTPVPAAIRQLPLPRTLRATSVLESLQAPKGMPGAGGETPHRPRRPGFTAGRGAAILARILRQDGDAGRPHVATGTAPGAGPADPTRARSALSWTDDYAWLRDPAYPEVTDPEIRAYLEAENAWFERFMAPLRPEVERLHAELKAQDQGRRPLGAGARGRLRVSLAVLRGRPVPDLVPPARSTPTRPAGRCLDEAELAEGKAYFNLRALDVSPDGRLLAYTTDEDGSERYRLHLRDLGTGARARRPGRQHLGRGRVGRGRPDAALCRAQRPAAARTASAPTAWATTRPATPSSTRRTTRPSSSRSPRRAAAASS